MPTRKKKMVMACPNCGSTTDIEYASTIKQSGAITGLGLPEVYYCKNCGYQGSVILEISEKDLNRTKFKKKTFVRGKPEKSSVEVLKPAFTILFFIFFAASVFIFIPEQTTVHGQKIQYLPFLGEEITMNIEGTEVMPRGYALLPSGEELVIVENKYGEVFYVSPGNASFIEPVESATGISSVTGFLFPLFLMFFSIAVLLLLVYSSTVRAIHFK